MHPIETFYVGGMVATFALQVLEHDGEIIRPWFQACIWPIMILVSFADAFGWLREDGK